MKNKILNARTHRRYKNEKVPLETIKSILNSAKNCPSAVNMQLTRYIIVNNDEELKSKIFKLTNLGTVHKVENGYEPKGYIISLVEKEKVKRRDYLNFDQGIAYQSINLMMNDYGLKTVCLFSPNKEKLEEVLGINMSKYEVCYALGYGYPLDYNRKIIETDDISLIKYFKDENGIYNVPKLKLSKILIDEK